MLTTSFLRRVPVFADLADDQLQRLAERVREREARAGDWVIREGEAAESLYVVSSGRLEVVDEGPPEVLIRAVRRGEVVGELALLRRGLRSASVRATRDVVLLELARDDFEALIQEAPSFALGLTRSLGAQLAASRSPVMSATPPRTIAVLGLGDGVPAATVARELADGLARHGSVAVLRDGDLSTIDQAESDRDRVVLDAGSAADGWTDMCVREAELIVAVVQAPLAPLALAEAPVLRGCELIVLGRGVSAAELAALQPREVQVILEPARRPAAMQATARRLAGRSLGLVLSGGGARALAHLGVIEELRAAGLVIDRVAGVSLGSLVAAAFAAGFSTEAIHDMARLGFVHTNPSNDVAFPAYSMLRGSKTRRLLREVFGDRRIEQLPLRFFCLSCDLIAREAVVHRSGPVVDATYASLAIPGVFPPVVTSDGRLLVDGGVLDNLPVATMARTGEGPVIAVDVTGRVGHVRAARREGVGRAQRPLRRLLTGSEAEIPRLAETIVRSMTVGSIDTVAAARLHADLVIAPRTDGIGLMEWRAFDRVVELGRQAARESLARIGDTHVVLGGA